MFGLCIYSLNMVFFRERQRMLKGKLCKTIVKRERFSRIANDLFSMGIVRAIEKKKVQNTLGAYFVLNTSSI